MRKHNDPIWVHSINEILLGGGDPDWRNVHINYFYSNELKEVVERQRKSHEYMHNVNMQKGYRQGECFLHSAWDKQAH